MKRNISLFCWFGILLSFCANARDSGAGGRPVWKHISSKSSQLPQPNGGLQQTAAVTFDIDGDGGDDFVLAERTQAPAIIWMRQTPQGWEKHIIENRQIRPEAGGLLAMSMATATLT
ncbi:MAG: hypothetical protein ACE15E_09500 [Acidobacteriota bacterium]